MNKNLKYDPEDIESLLLYKEFYELYPEEKEFVLRHIESETEYNSLRKTLHSVIDSGKRDEWIEPDPIIKQNLLAELAKEDRKGFTVWLNSLFAFPSIPAFKRPSFQIAFAGIAVLAVLTTIYFLSDKEKVQTLAKLESNEKVPSESSIPSAENQTKDQLIAEITEPVQSNELPPAPMPLPPSVKQIQFTELEVMDYVSEDVQTDSNFSIAPSESTIAIEENVSIAEPQVNKTVAQSTVPTLSSAESIEINAAQKKEAGSTFDLATIETKNLGVSKFKDSTGSVNLKNWEGLLDLLYTAP